MVGNLLKYHKQIISYYVSKFKSTVKFYVLTWSIFTGLVIPTLHHIQQLDNNYGMHTAHALHKCNPITVWQKPFICFLCVKTL